MKTATCSSIIRCHGLVMAAAMVMLVTAGVNAAIIGTYVNATAGPGGNTVRTSDGDTGSDATWLYDGVGAWGDSQWFNINADAGWSPARIGFTNILNNQARTDGTSAPPLTMTVTAPNPLGIYNVYLVFETDDTTAGGSTTYAPTPYDIHAGLSSNSLALFDSSSGGYTGSSREIFAGSRYLNQRQVLLGVVSNSTISVYVDDSVQPVGTVENNTRWEGIAFDQIGMLPVPEPTITLLLGVGGFVLWRRRQK